MATYKPDETRWRAQLDSIRRQTHHDWHCWVVDDASPAADRARLRAELQHDSRFTLVEHDVNVGFYRNFERALALVPEHYPWVALADQDDEWAPEKLERLLAAARSHPRACLVYSDVEIRDDGGETVSPTYWVGRRHNESDLAGLLFANTVTGAAAIVRCEVVQQALPFPPQFPSSFHDHWLALVARCLGEITYVDEALHAYVQHDSNAIGHQPGRSDAGGAVLLRTMRRAWWRRPKHRYYDDEVARLATLAAELLVRFPHVAADERRLLGRAARLHTRRPPLMWMLQQAAAEIRDPSVTMMRRRRVLASEGWTLLARIGRVLDPTARRFPGRRRQTGAG